MVRETSHAGSCRTPTRRLKPLFFSLLVATALVSFDTGADELLGDALSLEQITPIVLLQKEDTVCLADAVYYEARGESEKGQIAVVNVILNRAGKGKICDVIRRTYKGQCAFSFVCDKNTKISDRVLWNRIKALASTTALKYYNKDNYHDITKGATHFHVTSVNPEWSKEMQVTAEIGSHKFYR